MRPARPVVLAVVAAAASAALASLAARDCGAQETPPRPAAPEAGAGAPRTHDLSGIRAAGRPSTAPVRPFGWLPAHRAVAEWEEPEIGPSPDAVAELLVSLLAPADREASSLVVRWPLLHVRTSAEGHRRVEQGLEAFRRAEGTPFRFEVRAAALAPGAEGDALLDAVERAPGGRVPPEVAERLLAADRDGGAFGGTVDAVAGRWTALEQTGSRSYVTDWDVEIAQAASIADPISQQVEDGLRAALRAQRLLDGRALVTVTAAAAEIAGSRRVELRTKDLGAVEMPEVRGAYAASSTPLRAGETAAFVAAAPVSDAASVRRVLLVRLLEAPPALDLGAVSLLPVGAFTSPRSHTWLAVPGADSVQSEEFVWGLEVRHAEEGPLSGASASDLVEAVRQAAPDAAAREGNTLAAADGWSDGSVLVVQGDAQLRDAARATAARLEAESVRAARVSVRLVARGAAPGGAAADRTLGILSAPTVLGGHVALAAYVAAPYVADYDVEVAQEARISDPRPAAAVGGAVLGVTLAQGAGTSLRADLDLVVTHLGALETVGATATEVGVVERIPLRRVRVAQSVVLDGGRAREVELGRNPWGGGRLVAVVRAERVE